MPIKDTILSGSLIFREGGIELARMDASSATMQITGALHITGANLLLNGSDLENRISILEAGNTGSVILGDILVWTGSVEDRLTNLYIHSQSLNDFTSSYNTGSFTGSFIGDGSGLIGIVSSSYALTASFVEWDNVENKPDGIISRSAQITALGFISESASGVNYISQSTSQSLTEIEVVDYDNNVSVDFTTGRLKFIFGAPGIPSDLSLTLSGFETDRFNNVNDNYTINGSWNNQGYTLISASLFTGSVLITEVGTGTSLSNSPTTSGSQDYRLEYTASSPLDSSIFTGSVTVSGTLSKIEPTNPSVSYTATVQLGATSNQIEQGATGSISFTPSYGTANGWTQTSLTTAPPSSPFTTTGFSASLSITTTANYESPTGDNIPQIFTNKQSSRTYSVIRSVRYGALASSSLTQSEIENLDAWDTTLGGSAGIINKGTVNPNGDSGTFSWSGDKYHYIIYNSSQSDLTDITTSGFGVFGQFSKSTVGDYTVYITNDLQAGGAGTSITYDLEV